MAIFTTLSVVIQFYTGTPGIFATLDVSEFHSTAWEKSLKMLTK